jgi:hypothetical protein
MTKLEYARLGYNFPECDLSYSAYSESDPKNVTIRVGKREEFFVVEIPGFPTREDVLFQLMDEANLATMYLRDFVRDWPNQSWCGRGRAVREWRRLRHQRRQLKTLFGDQCP